MGRDTAHLSAGVIPQKDDEFRSPLLQDGFGFPGISELVNTYKSSDLKVTLFAEQTIPTAAIEMREQVR